MSETVEQIQVEKPKRNIWKIIIPVIIIVVVAGAVLAYWWLSRPQIPQTPWLFKGAYSEYKGETTVMFYSINMTVRIEVVDYNSTHAKLLYYMNMEMDGETFTEQETMWSDLREETYEVEDFTLETSYEDHVYLEELGTRYCMVYEYSGTDMTIQIFVDKQTTWPVKWAYSYAFGLDTDINIELTLVESNIPGMHASRAQLPHNPFLDLVLATLEKTNTMQDNKSTAASAENDPSYAKFVASIIPVIIGPKV